VVDNTNPTPAEREPLVAIARAAGARAVSYAFLAAVSAAVQRNALRTGRARIPDAGIYSVAKRLCPVLASEGFDQRFVVELADDDFVLTELLLDDAHPRIVRGTVAE
jgi:hypothetical protein